MIKTKEIVYGEPFEAMSSHEIAKLFLECPDQLVLVEGEERFVPVSIENTELADRRFFKIVPHPSFLVTRSSVEMSVKKKMVFA
jgi:hypothetical protein